MRIAMRRGDIKWLRFQIETPDGFATDINFTNIYFTVKKSYRDKEPCIRKSLKRKQIYKIADGDYQIKIDAADTRNLLIGDYKYDIQLVYKNIIKETFVGDFALKEEITSYDLEDEEDEEDDVAYIDEDDNEPVILQVPNYHIVKLETPKPVHDGDDTAPIPIPELEDITEGDNGHA